MTADVVTRIDETLTYYSAELGADLSVPVEKQAAWVDAEAWIAANADAAHSELTPWQRAVLDRLAAFDRLAAAEPIASVLALTPQQQLAGEAWLKRDYRRFLARIPKSHHRRRCYHVDYSRRLRARRRRA